jgi:hypothetical protein
MTDRLNRHLSRWAKSNVRAAVVLALFLPGLSTLTGCRELGNLRRMNAQQERRIAELTQEATQARQELYAVRDEKERQALWLQARIDELSRRGSASTGATDGRTERLEEQLRQLSERMAAEQAAWEQQKLAQQNELEALRRENRELRERLGGNRLR